MNFIRRYSVIVGSSILIAVAVLLLSSSDLFFSSGVSFIGTELYNYSGDEVYVQTRMDFGSNKHMEEFPLQIEDWQGVKYDASDWKKQLNADAGVMLGYLHPQSLGLIYLVIMQSESASSFHPPDLCYVSQGFAIEETGNESVIVEDQKWIENPVMEVPLARLIVYQETEEEEIYNRRLALYCYVRENKYTSDEVTMIRVSTVIPDKGSYDDYLDMEKQFFADTLPLMFDPAEEEGWNPVVMELAGWGIGGYFLISLLIAVPVGIIVFPRTRWGRKGTATTGSQRGT